MPRMTIDDPWLNKLVGNATFIGQTDNLNPNLPGRFLLEVEDPDDKQHDYQLWYMQNDHNKLLAFCGRDKGKKPKIVDDDECETSKHGSKKGDGKKVMNETLSKVVKER
ncbi:hypothetical protein Tco_0860833 [Tanacetum coccineum]|uniref:Uncharacterized protein n=1 Tax=Tanacetum coccineum TaxID=301880 RepID=A0ABQ5BG27_9ASTR